MKTCLFYPVLIAAVACGATVHALPRMQFSAATPETQGGDTSNALVQASAPPQTGGHLSSGNNTFIKTILPAIAMNVPLTFDSTGATSNEAGTVIAEDLREAKTIHPDAMPKNVLSARAYDKLKAFYAVHGEKATTIEKTVEKNSRTGKWMTTYEWTDPATEAKITVKDDDQVQSVSMSSDKESTNEHGTTRQTVRAHREMTGNGFMQTFTSSSSSTSSNVAPFFASPFAMSPRTIDSA